MKKLFLSAIVILFLSACTSTPTSEIPTDTDTTLTEPSPVDTVVPTVDTIVVDSTTVQDSL